MRAAQPQSHARRNHRRRELARVKRRRRLALLAIAVAALVVVGLLARREVDHRINGDPHGSKVRSVTVHSRYVGKNLDQLLVMPDGGDTRGRPLLVLFHGRDGRPTRRALGQRFFDELDRLGPRAPNVVFANGDIDSYYHDRATGRYGTYVMREVIPMALRQTKSDRKRIAVGGISMGGFGALDLASRHPDRFCAVGGHSPALWRFGGETPAGAFDGAEDFARHDVMARSATPGAFGRARVWLDAGTRDPFLSATRELASTLEAQGRDAQLHVWNGSHDGRYWGRHMPDYLRFYARTLARCKSR